MSEVTCGCHTGGSGGLLASPGKGKDGGELPTEHRTMGAVAHTGSGGGMPAPERWISQEAPRVYQASSLEAGQEWA